MKCSDQLDKLAPALVQAQMELSNLPKTATNPHFKSKFVPLDDVTAAIHEVYPKHGLAFVQFPTSDGDRMGVETVIMHESGQWISQSFEMGTAKDDPQGAGSAFTYARRYAGCAVNNIAGDDDDDGEHATAKRQEEPANLSLVQPPATDAERKGFEDGMLALGYTVPHTRNKAAKMSGQTYKDMTRAELASVFKAAKAEVEAKSGGEEE